MKRQRNTTPMKEQTRNTEVQINWGNRQTTWKRIQNNNSKNDQKPWKQNGENARINKDLEELKINIQRQAAQLLKLKIL